MARAAALVATPLALAVFALASPAGAATFSFQASADTYVNEAYPKKSYGAGKRMWTQGDSPLHQTFARFKVTGLSGAVTAATLRFYVSDGTGNGPAVYTTSSSWSERSMSWRTRPGATSGPADDKGALSAGEWVGWDVTRWVAGDGTYSFVLKDGGGNATGLYSRETARDPVLVVTTADDPPPPPPPPPPACANGVDDDGDGHVDLADPGCTDASDTDETDPVVTPVTTEPAAVAGLGYHQAFRDDFDRLDRSVWDNHIWYDETPLSAWTDFQTVENGILHLRTRRQWVGSIGAPYPYNTITTQSSGLTFTEGYFEARMKWTGARGAWPGFWLFSYRHATNDFWPSVNPYCANNGLPKALCYSAELDVFEGQGAEPNVFYGTIHRNSCGCYGLGDSQNGNNYQLQSFNIAADWHTYGLLWTASKVTWYLDGQPLMSAPTYDSTNQPMFLLLQMWTGGWTGDPNFSTPDLLETQVDYVDVWQK
jgi:beta-glucanase (GH16 family)